MKAWRFERYGGPEVLHLTDVPTPSPGPGEVLVRLRATSINDWDWAIIRGELSNRIMNGLIRPRKLFTPGSDVAGVVEAVGESVQQFRVGDAVYGDLCSKTWGCFAEYVCAREYQLVKKPDAMSFEQAAAIPQAGLLALQGLEGAGLRNGQEVLLNGAGGGAGTFGLQIARMFDTRVTVVDSAHKLGTLLNMGADAAIDFALEDFSERENAWDVILDARSTRAPRDVLRALKPGGCYATVGGQLHRLAQIYLASRHADKKYGRDIKVIALKPNHRLEFYSKQFEASSFTAVIDGPYPFDRLDEAMRQFSENQHIGKVVISFPD